MKITTEKQNFLKLQFICSICCVLTWNLIRALKRKLFLSNLQWVILYRKWLPNTQIQNVRTYYFNLIDCNVKIYESGSARTWIALFLRGYESNFNGNHFKTSQYFGSYYVDLICCGVEFDLKSGSATTGSALFLNGKKPDSLCRSY